MVLFFIFFSLVASEPLNRIELQRSSEFVMNNTRRIMHGQDAGDTRPYMVYIRPASTATLQIEQNWLCGGAIIDAYYILTSAACIEDVQHFYVVSGTDKWVSPQEDESECVNNGQKKAVWKCVPKNYVYDGNEFDNIRWMINDIAVVKVEEEFNFSKKIKGCDYVPTKILYNNQSVDLEKPKTHASIAGWGSINMFSEISSFGKGERAAANSEILLETEVMLLSKKHCKNRWNERYHYIIDHYMICGKDSFDTDVMNSACADEVNCKELVYSDEDDVERRKMNVPNPAIGTARRVKTNSGGFCENDHGGPLVVGHGKTAVVIGIISASQIRVGNNNCYGPFLYSSVWNNRHLISCAIDKEMGATCRALLRTSRTQMSETYFDWRSHPDGPAKGETPMPVTVPTITTNVTVTSTKSTKST